MRASPRNPHARSLSAASSPAAHGSAQGIARWRATIAAQVAQIQREGWRKGLFGRTRLSNPRPGGGGGVDLAFRRAFRAFAALWVAQDDAAPGGSAHLHADDDLVPPGSPAPGGRGKRIPPLSRLGQLVVLVLLALGLREVFSPSRTAPRRRGAGPVRVKGRNPFAVLAELEGGGAPSRYETHVPGVEHVWKTSGAPVDAYSDAGEEGDTTAVVLHWKRTDNVGVILAHLCQHTFFDSVFVWNNNPDVVLTPQTFAKSRCPPSKLRIYNSPRNLFFLARYLACAQSSTPHCFFQDDDWLVRPVRALYAQFRRDPEGPVVVSTNEEVAALYGLEWCFYNNPLHTCFAWVGTGAFTSRTHVDRFLLHTGATADARDELAHADNSFTTSLNEPPYVLQSALAPLPAPHGHSDGEGIARNKGYIWKGLARLSSQLNITYPPPAAPGAPLTTLVLPPPGPGPYRLPSAPPLPPHPHAHHARAPCLPRGACTFLTNVQLLPPPDAAAFPGLEAVRSLDEWEEHLGHTARGWREGGERWSAEEDWARRWSYANAVDGEVRSVFRSPDVVKTCDYLALGLLAPLDAAWTPTATLHVVLAHAEAVLAKTRVEVSPDGWRWFAPAGATAPPPKWTCARAPLAALAALAPPDAPFPDSGLLSPRGRRALAAAEAAEGSGVLGRWWARQRRRRAAGARECSVSVGAALGEEAGGGEGRGWRFVRVVVVQGEGEEDGREVLDIGWAVAEMWLSGARGA